MEKFVRGDIVVIPFPFSDLSESKRRPALVLALLENDDVLLCQITSRTKPDSSSIPIDKSDFMHGSLPVASFVRCGKLFAASVSIIERIAGRLKPESLLKVANRNADIVLGEELAL